MAEQSALITIINVLRPEWKRVLTLAAVLFFILLFWYNLISVPIKHSKVNISSQIEEKQAKVKGLEKRLIEMETIAKKSGSTPEQLRLSQVKKERIDIEKHLNAFSPTLVEFQHIPDVLKEILKNKTKSMEIQKVETVPPIFLGNEKNEELVAKNVINISFRSDYFTMVAFIEKLESMQWQIDFNELHYDVQEYPKGNVLLSIEIPGVKNGLLHS